MHESADCMQNQSRVGSSGAAFPAPPAFIIDGVPAGCLVMLGGVPVALVPLLPAPGGLLLLGAALPPFVPALEA
jgi:hypothetical protein